MSDEMYLYEIEDETLEHILHMADAEKHRYFLELIRTFYPGSDKEVKKHLMAAYYSSFVLEFMYRNHELLGSAFTVTYTPTGQIREVSNDIYNFEEPHKYQIN